MMETALEYVTGLNFGILRMLQADRQVKIAKNLSKSKIYIQCYH